jgi:tetratricopeptide (TPR) repeat protein
MLEPTPQWQPRDLLAERSPDLDLALNAWDVTSDAAINADRNPDSTLLDNMRAQAINLGLDALLRDQLAQTRASEAGSSYALIAVAEHLLSKHISFEDAIGLLQAPEIIDRDRIIAVLYAGAIPRLRQDSLDLIVNRLAADTANSDELAARCYLQVGDRMVNEDAEYALQSYSSAIRKIGAAGIKELRGPSFRGLARCWLEQKKYDEAAKAAREARGFDEQSGDASGAESAAVLEAMAHLGNSNYEAAATIIRPVIIRQRQCGIASRSIDGTTILAECIKAAASQAFRLAQARDAAAITVYDAAIGMAGDTGYQYSDQARDRCLIGQALVLGNNAAAGQRQLELAVEVARAQGPPQVLLTTLISLGDWLRHVQDPRAIAICEEGLALAEQLNDVRQIVTTQVLLGSAFRQAGQLDAAIEHLGRANSQSSHPAFRAMWILALFEAHRDSEALAVTDTLDGELAALPHAEMSVDTAHLTTLMLELVQKGHSGLAQRLNARMQAATVAAARDQGASASSVLQEFESRARGVLARAGTQLMSGNLAAVVAAAEPLLQEARQFGALNVELATAYMLGETALNGRRFADSLRLLESVVEKARDVQPMIYASALNKIGTVFTQLGKADLGLPYQERAIEAHRELGNWSALVVALVQAAQSCVTLKRLDQAKVYADELEILGPTYPPADAEWVTSVPALVAALRGDRERAKDKFRATVTELERKRQQFTTADQQRTWGRMKADLYGQAIEAAIMRDDPTEAIAYLELARNRYLNAIAREKATTAAMSTDAAGAEPWAPGPATTDSLAALLPLNSSFVWCAAFVRGMGIVAASCRQGKVELTCRFYPEITYEVVVGLGHGEIGNGPSGILERLERMKRQTAADEQAQTGAFWQSGEGEDWNRRIQCVADSVRAVVWPRIFETIGEPSPVVVLLPSIGCTELPLAAAAPDRWPGDVPLSVCFAPSLASLTPPDALDCTPPQNLTQVENPTEDPSLACCSLESEAVGALFASRPQVVRGRRAHRGRVMKLIADADIFHFMGHAWCDWHEPLDSGMLCAGRSDEPQALTVRELFNAGRIKARLIVLSACEISNVQPGDKQNDFINLPAALVALGASCVIAPRWRVDDVAASMFSANLFKRWVTGASILEALAGARLWLRDEVTRSVVDKWLDNRDSESPDAGRLEDIKRSLKERYSPEDRPFQHVAHWGAFEMTGDPYPFGVNHA